MIDLISYGITYGLLVSACLVWLVAPISWAVGFFVEQVTESPRRGMNAENWVMKDTFDNVYSLFGERIKVHTGWFVFSAILALILGLVGGLDIADGVATSYVEVFSNVSMCVHPYISKIVLAVVGYIAAIRISRIIYRICLRVAELEKKL